MLLVAALAGGIVAYQQRQATHRGQWEADVRALASTSQALQSAQPDVAALLAMESHSMDPSAASESALFATFTSAPGLRRATRIDLDVGPPQVSGSFLPDGETLAVADGHGAVHVINLTDGTDERLAPMSEAGIGAAVLSVSADGRFVAVLWYSFLATDHSLLTVWDLQTGERRFEPVSIASRRSAVAISADGAFVAVGGYAELPTELRDGATGEPSRTVAAIRPPSDVYSSAAAMVAFAPDGRLAVGSRAGPIRFIDPATGDESQRIDAPPRSSDSALLFPTDGTVLFAVGQGGFISYDVETGRALTDGVQGPSVCHSPVYSAQISALICKTSGGHVVAFGIIGRDLETPHIDTDTATVCGLMISADGRTLAEISSCASGGATIREWVLDGGGAVSQLAYAPLASYQTIEGYGFAGNSSALRAWITKMDDFATVIDPATGEVIDEFPNVYGLKPTDDPSVVYVLIGESSVATYDVVHHAPVAPVDVGFVTNPDVWSTRGSLVAVGGDDASEVPIRKVRIVDFASRTYVGAADRWNGNVRSRQPGPRQSWADAGSVTRRRQPVPRSNATTP